MGKYGEAAVKAVHIFREGDTISVMDAWNRSVAEVFPHSKSSQVKGCPCGTFLGLCETGMVAGIPAGDYTRSKKNKGYGLKAVDLLRLNPKLINDENILWIKIIGDEEKVPNHQMDVVISLWNNGFVETKNA